MRMFVSRIRDAMHCQRSSVVLITIHNHGGMLMKSTQSRFFPRQQCAIPIEHAFHRSHHYHDSIVYNKSISGLYFETTSSIEPESIVHISVKNQPLHRQPAGALRYFKARAKWCRPGRTGRFGVGAQLLEAKCSIDAAESYPIVYECDLCGRPTGHESLTKLAEGVFVCACCDDHFGALGDTQIKACLLDVLMRSSDQRSHTQTMPARRSTKP
jgi:ribosomal protein L37AE/L43A